MDRIITAVVAALANQSLPKRELSNPHTADLYQALKTALSQKYGSNSDLMEALQFFERKPKSAARRTAFQEEIDAVQAEQDTELLNLADNLMDSVKPLPIRAETRYLIPIQRPPQADYFVGRATDLEKIIGMLQPGQRISLTGPDGVGKSALVAAAIWSLSPQDALSNQYPDGIIYHNLNNQPRVDVALEMMVKAFGQEPLPTLYEAAARIVADRRALLVFDGIEMADDLAGLLDLRGQCGLLLVGSHAPDAVTIEYSLSALPVQDGLLLLQAWSEGRAEDIGAAQKICELLGGLPLSIRLAGHAMVARKEDAASYLAWLETTPLAQAKPEERCLTSVNVLLAQTLSRLGQPARRVLSVVGLLAVAPFDQKTISHALLAKESQGVVSSVKEALKLTILESDTSLNVALRELNSHGLLWWAERRYEVSHPVIHAFVRQQLPVDSRLLQRLATHYISLVSSLAPLGFQSFPRLEAARPHFMTVLNECLEQENWQAAHELAVVVEDYLDRQGSLIERIIANEAGLIAAWHLGRPSEGAWLGNLGDTYRIVGQLDWAIQHFIKALEIARKHGDRYSEGNNLGNLGLAYRDLGDVERAKNYLKESKVIFERLGSPRADLVRDWLMEWEACED